MDKESKDRIDQFIKLEIANSKQLLERFDAKMKVKDVAGMRLMYVQQLGKYRETLLQILGGGKDE